ncbi:MAG TPA: glycoside hydrolase family 3 N-terminal domain-containing protein [Bacteroidales bacterium]|nr:glycoside hydrolase family 3 N-terminal domain-containing protein [Bacteroidales bacterium]
MIYRLSSNFNKILISVILLFISMSGWGSQIHNFRNTRLTIDERADALLGELTLHEKIAMLGHISPPVERLQIPSYNWWNEALHGVARAGTATVFPQAIGLAATFDSTLVYNISTSIATEARSKFNLSTGRGRHLQYMGLTFFSPAIDLFRDPRWGRGQETYGEDPFLTSTMGRAFVTGLQGNIPGMLKTAAVAKHFPAYSGPEGIRHYFNAIIDEKDLRESYLPAFKALVDHGVAGIMCAYNRVNGEPSCTGETFLRRLLREEWGFTGMLVTDCWALDDIWLRHRVIPTRVEVTAAAIKAGVNLECGNILQQDVEQAIKEGLITEEDVNRALLPSLRTQFKLGFFDPPGYSPFAHLGADSVNTPFNIHLARRSAAQSMVLLKNNGILPLNKENIGSIMVVGENAASINALVGNYHGLAPNFVTFVEGIVKAVGPGISVNYDLGVNYIDTVNFGGIWAASLTDVVIAVLGLNPLLEGERGDAFLAAAQGDRISLSIPRSHILYLQRLKKEANRPVITVLTGGSALNINEIKPYSDAIIMAWYPGEQGGNALADIIFGKVSPSGRLPITFYNCLNDLPDFTDYSMANRTYRYFQGEVQFPFGFGLSYTSFDYKWVRRPGRSFSENDLINIRLRITNTGEFDANEVVQVYIGYPEVERMPIRELKGFYNVFVNAGESKTVRINIPVNNLKKWSLDQRTWKLYPGRYRLYVSRNSQEHIFIEEFSIGSND